MPSTVVHVALAGLVGTALLAEYFDAKSVLVVMAATALVDFDTFLGIWIEGAHRAAFHTLVLPLLGGVLLWWDLRGREYSWIQSHLGGRRRSGDRGRTDWRDRARGLVRVSDRSRIRSRWGARGVRVSWVSLVAITLAGIGPDLFFNGANIFYPIHDQFFDFSGKMLYSNHRGFVQTMIDLNVEALFEQFFEAGSEAGSESGAGSNGGGGGNSKPASTTENTHYRTGIDPSKGKAPENVERIFPIAMTGERALLALTGYSVVGLRVWMERRME